MPSPHAVPDGLPVVVVDHPLAQARLSTMRDARTDNATFRAALQELTLMLIYEATRDLAISLVPIHTPVARTNAVRLANPPLLVPVLRAGLGMADQAHRLIPESQMGFVGIARNEQTLEPQPYMESLPESLAGRPVFVLDPMLATGGSMVHTIQLLLDPWRHRRHRDLCAGRARGAGHAAGRRPRGAGGDRRRSTSGSTTPVTSSRVSGTRGTGSSARSDPVIGTRSSVRRLVSAGTVQSISSPASRSISSPSCQPRPSGSRS